METSCNSKFLNSPYHQALLQWNVYNSRDMPAPVQSPYYNEEVYNIIRSANNKNLPVASMKTKDWYQFILSSILHEPDTDTLIPCRVELRFPQNDWMKTWALARLRGLSSVSCSFLWQLIHQLLPVRERLERILPTVDSATCQVCDTGERDSLLHALVLCPNSSAISNWLMSGLRRYTMDLTAEKMLLLDFAPRDVLPHEELPLVWFTAEVLQRLWKRRRDGRACRLYEMRAEMEAAVNLMRRTKFSAMAPVLDAMME